MCAGPPAAALVAWMQTQMAGCKRTAGVLMWLVLRSVWVGEGSSLLPQMLNLGCLQHPSARHAQCKSTALCQGLCRALGLEATSAPCRTLASCRHACAVQERLKTARVGWSWVQSHAHMLQQLVVPWAHSPTLQTARCRP